MEGGTDLGTALQKLCAMNPAVFAGIHDLADSLLMPRPSINPERCRIAGSKPSLRAGDLVKSHTREQMALFEKHPDNGRPVPHGVLPHTQRTGSSL